MNTPKKNTDEADEPIRKQFTEASNKDIVSLRLLFSLIKSTLSKIEEDDVLSYLYDDVVIKEYICSMDN